MVRIILFLIAFISFRITLIAQHDLDNIDRDGYYIIKTGLEKSNTERIKASGLRSKEVAEEFFGKNYKIERWFGELTRFIILR